MPRALPLVLCFAIASGGAPAGRTTDDAAPVLACAVSEPGRRLLTLDGGRYPVVLGVGGDLAGPVEPWSARSGTKGWAWVLHMPTPPLLARLRAERLDGAGAVEFEILRAGTTTAPLVWPTGGLGYVYLAVKRDPVITESGCWKVSLVGGAADDSVVLWISR